MMNSPSGTSTISTPCGSISVSGGPAGVGTFVGVGGGVGLAVGSGGSVGAGVGSAGASAGASVEVCPMAATSAPGAAGAQAASSRASMAGTMNRIIHTTFSLHNDRYSAPYYTRPARDGDRRGYACYVGLSRD